MRFSARIVKFCFFVLIFSVELAYSKELVLDCETVQWVFETQQGLLTELRYKQPQMDKYTFEPPCSLWELRSGDDKISAKTDSIIFSFVSEKDTWRFTWNGSATNNDHEKIPLEVILDIKPSGDTLELSFSGNISRLQLDEIVLPAITGVNMDVTMRIVVPYWMGEIYDSEIYPEKSTGFTGERAWEYPGTLSMQWVGMYNTNCRGICLWVKDIQKNYKSVHVHGDGKRGGMEWRHLVSAKEGSVYQLPYIVCLTGISGDWYDMAVHYRNWARQQSWALQSRKAQQQISPWVEDTALWVWNRTDSKRVLSPAIDMAERLQLPVSVLWHWWHGCAYDIGFPEYLPPREGQESFSNALAEARQKGIHALIYVNQRLWGTTTKSWKERKAEQFAVHGKDGKIHPETYNIFNPAPCVAMCMGTDFWHNTLLQIMLPVWRESSVAGFYLDQACSSLPCFATNHGHIPGEKDFWIKGFQQLTLKLREGCKDKNTTLSNGKIEELVLAGEGCGEAWLPFLDLFLSLQVSKERYTGGDGWRSVPLFQAVYHPVAILFGNYASLTEPPYDPLWNKEFAPAEPLKLLDARWNTQFRFEQACAWAWGQQPTIANYKIELWNDRKEELDFVLKMARLHYKFREFFLNGELLKPLPEENIDTWDEICLSVYAHRKEGGKTFQRRGTLLITAPWRSPDGKVALAVVNADSKERLLQVHIPAKQWNLNNEGKIIKHQVDKSIEVSSYSNGIINFSHTIDKGDALLFEFK